MAISRAVIHHLQVQPGHAAGLPKRDTAWTGGKELAHLHGKDGKGAKKRMKAELQTSRTEIDREQELLWANDRRSLLLVFQAMDAAGKDGTIKHVMAGVNPQGCRVTSFKQPSALELDHDFLWRINRALPERGQIGIFNRSHYEEVLVVRVHPDWLERQQLPPGRRGPQFWKQRYESINDFEQHLDRNGTTIVKFFLHVSRQEQRRRFLDRLTEPGKEWKFSSADVAERQHWDAYMDAYEKAITATSTPWAPWYVIPADNKDLMRMLVAGVVVHTIRRMKLTFPTVSEEQHESNMEARRQLEAEVS
jgi:PPK2 family polyphosphate:nucleotide phosphotransferase